jgi:GTP-binding protein
LLHLIDLTETDLVNTYKKIKLELSTYDKKLSKKKEIIVFNKSDLLDNGQITEKLNKFKKKIKSKYEVISAFSNKDLLKVKKLLIKNVN